MKNLFIPLVLFSQITFGQTVTYEQCQDISFTANYATGDTISTYVLKDGSEVKKGSKLTFGKPLNGSLKFSRLYLGEVTLGKSLLLPPETLGEIYIAEEVVVTEIKVIHTKLTKSSPLVITLFVQNPAAPLGMRNRTIMDLEKAIETGEVINPNAALTREQAIAKLKEAKDLFDLGLMTEADYNLVKEKLTPIIVGTKE
jgi:hypothetical protein